jgi:hypothetical protein
MSTRNLSGGKGRLTLKADNLTATCGLIGYKNIGTSTSQSSEVLYGLLGG